MIKKTKKVPKYQRLFEQTVQLSISVTIDIITVSKSLKVRWQESEKESR